MNIKTIRANLLLVLTAMLWGAAFVAQSSAMEDIPPLTFNGIRMLLGAAVLVPVYLFMHSREKKRTDYTPITKKDIRFFALSALCCGVALFAGSTFQNYGLLYTSAGKGGFITTLYVIMVPLLSMIFLKGKKTGKMALICAAIAVVGFYFLALGGGMGNINLGDMLILVCAFMFAIHIIIVDYFSPRMNGVLLSILQFFVVGVISLVGALIFEAGTFPPGAIKDAMVSILYAGICSCGIAYTLQVVAQKDTHPTVAALLMSLESVFAVLFGWLILKEQLEWYEYIGCAIVFAAVILSQIPAETFKKKKN